MSERLERRPIFLHCFSRGGSNLLWNVFLSHPEVASPIEETLQIFRTDWRAPRLAGFRAILLSRRPRFFDQWNLAPRRPLPERAARFVDRTLHRRKMKTVDDPEMGEKAPGERYTAAEVERTRLVAKNNNGLALLTEPLAALYPDATFFGLLRHPVALYESHRRRRITGSPEEFARTYERLAGAMLADSRERERYHLVRFEELLREPAATARRLYAQAGLDAAAVPKLRFKAKAHVRPDGSYGSNLALGRHFWFGWDELDRYFEPQVNALQSERVDPDEEARLLELVGPLAERLGYPTRPAER